jgi:hypothetical protein
MHRCFSMRQFLSFPRFCSAGSVCNSMEYR